EVQRRFEFEQGLGPCPQQGCELFFKRGRPDAECHSFMLRPAFNAHGPAERDGAGTFAVDVDPAPRHRRGCASARGDLLPHIVVLRKVQGHLSAAEGITQRYVAKHDVVGPGRKALGPFHLRARHAIERVQRLAKFLDVRGAEEGKPLQEGRGWHTKDSVSRTGYGRFLSSETAVFALSCLIRSKFRFFVTHSWLAWLGSTGDRRQEWNGAAPGSTA